MNNENYKEYVNPDMLLEFNKIIKEERVHTYYQPIVNLVSGEILGYEALSRGPENSMLHSPMALLSIGKLLNKTWELERILRIKALENAWFFENKKLLFLNVDPNVIKDEKFIKGFTKENLRKRNIDSNLIVLELTERSAIKCYDDFKKILKHYTDQGYQMAIDDAGSGYSGLKTIYEITPKYLKIDMDFIRDVHKDNFKQVIVKSLVNIAKSVNIETVAEGIEKVEELRTIMELGVDYGQGYYIQRPQQHYKPLKKSVIDIIKTEHELMHQLESNILNNQCIHSITERTVTFDQNTPCKTIYDYIKSNDNMGVCIVDDKKPIGLVTSQDIQNVFSQKYGHAVYSKREIYKVMNQSPMVVDFYDPIHKVAKLAMLREKKHIYDDVIVSKEEVYVGIVSMKRIIEYSINYEKKYAQALNPLTALPGNEIINQVIQHTIDRKKYTGIIYVDLDHFKSYNDYYGFESGDRVIKKTAEIIESANKKFGGGLTFLGHIGGDDFILVSTTSEYNMIEIMKSIIENIQQGHSVFYEKDDFEKGYITSTDRKGNVDKFSLLTVSIAACIGKFNDFTTVEEISQYIMNLKKEAKSKPFSNYVIQHVN